MFGEKLKLFSHGMLCFINISEAETILSSSVFHALGRKRKSKLCPNTRRYPFLFSSSVYADSLHSGGGKGWAPALLVRRPGSGAVGVSHTCPQVTFSLILLE